MNSDVEKSNGDVRSRLRSSLILLLVAFVCATTATVAWFTIADRTKLSSMDMEITSGISMRFDLDKHDKFDDYVKTLTFADIAKRIESDFGFKMEGTPLEPVTTSDTLKFTHEDGKVVAAESGEYLEFTLHFRATEDMVVHLTSSDSDSGVKGTAITSKNENMPSAMRISFTVGDDKVIYDPGLGDKSSTSAGVKTFGLPAGEDMKYSDDNALFFLPGDEDLPVLVHVWLEGTDELCTDDLRGDDYSIRLRFEGTDRNNKSLEDRYKE